MMISVNRYESSEVALAPVWNHPPDFADNEALIYWLQFVFSSFVRLVERSDDEQQLSLAECLVMQQLHL